MFIMLIRKTCPGLHKNILNFYKALGTSDRCFSLMTWSFSPTSKSEVRREGVTAGNLKSVSKQQPLLSSCQEKRGNQHH